SFVSTTVWSREAECRRFQRHPARRDAGDRSNADRARDYGHPAGHDWRPPEAPRWSPACGIENRGAGATAVLEQARKPSSPCPSFVTVRCILSAEPPYEACDDTHGTHRSESTRDAGEACDSGNPHPGGVDSAQTERRC